MVKEALIPIVCGGIDLVAYVFKGRYTKVLPSSTVIV
jgi:hypothetical protein